MASKLSNDQHNFVLLGIVCVDEIKLVLKDIFDSQIKPADLYNVINSCSELTTGRHKLRPEQLRLCSLSPPQVPYYDQFDVSLLYTLIRNLCPNLKPAKGWGKTPKCTDTNIGDDIERFRIFRNEMFAHLNSSEVPDCDFNSTWNILEGSIRRAQMFVNSLGYKVNYEEKLAKIKTYKLSCEELKNYKLFLQGMIIMTNGSQNTDIPVIKITGNGKIVCGENACFEAEIENCLDTDCWLIKWTKLIGNTTKVIDISMDKYSGSTSRRLLINNIEKEDQGEYQAVISQKIDRSYSSNKIFLEATGDLPKLNITKATSGRDSVTISYDCNAEKIVPSLQTIEWSKDGKRFTTNTNKYEGGGVTDNFLKILSPSENDIGEYTCKVFNAVGSISEVISLAAPSIKIGKVLTIENCQILTATFGDQVTIDSIIVSCPSPEKAIWQRSKDQTPDNFMNIDIDNARYFGSSLDPEKPILVISKVSNADNLYYRLEITNGIGKSTSNVVLLKLIGDIPSVFAKLETNIEDRRVTFHCKISLSDNYPEVTEIIWIKDKQYIDASSSGMKYTGGSKTDPPLVVHGVN